MMTEIQAIDGGQKDALLKSANIKKLLIKILYPEINLKYICRPQV